MKHLLLLSALAATVLLSPSCGNNSHAAKPASSLYINEVSHNAAQANVKVEVTIFPGGELFNFIVADKGTTAIEHYTPSFGEEKVKAVFLHLGHNYYGDHVSLSISTLDGDHVAGTFSGTFLDEGKSVNITDGSFDLPMRAKS